MPTYYEFSGITNATNSIFIIIPTPNDTLKQITYHNIQGDGTGMTVENVTCGYLDPGDYLDINITSYSNGIVNGTFSGKVSKILSLNPLTLQSATITNGLIKNVKVRYL